MAMYRNSIVYARILPPTLLRAFNSFRLIIDYTSECSAKEGKR